MLNCKILAYFSENLGGLSAIYCGNMNCGQVQANIRLHQQEEEEGWGGVGKQDMEVWPS